MCLTGAGLVLCLVAAVGFLLGPAEDSTGAGERYDQGVANYNQELERMQSANSMMPVPAKGKTRLQAHREDALFGLAVGAVMSVGGLIMILRNRL